MDKQVKEAQASLRGRFFRQDTSKPKEKLILVLKTKVVGYQFYIENSEEKEALIDIKPGTELLLYREPENKYDSLAIAVYLTETDKIGFIPRMNNETIARLMDAGKEFVTIVDEPEPPTEESKEPHEQPPKPDTEKVTIPISVYLVEH